MNDEHRPVPVHELDHAVPPALHHPKEDDSTLLARWLARGLEKGPVFWVLAIGAVAVVVGLATLASGLAASKTADPQSWVELMAAKTAEESLKLAEAHPDTPLAISARLQAANREYEQGFDALTNPAQRDLAGPRLKKALDLFRQVAKEAAKDSPQAPIAAFGVARTLEARNELPEAIKQYREVASAYPGTPEAKRSEVMVKALEDPANVAFYKELYAYKPPAAVTPPGQTTPPPLIPGMDPSLGIPSALDPTKSFLPSQLQGPTDIDPPPATTPAPGGTPPPATTPAPAAPGVEPKAEPKAELPANPLETPK
jgi:hypothetical protein